MSTVFVINPAAGNWATERHWPEIARRAVDRGLTGEHFVSREPGDITALAREAAAGGATLLVVVGGDGSVNEAVNGLLAAGGERPELALVPCGTGDDFARTFGIPTDRDAALEVAVSGKAREVDVGRARFRAGGGEQDRYFVNFAGAGISGAIARRGAATSKRLGARAAYFWATVAVFVRWKSVSMSVQAGSERRDGRMYEVLVANGAYAAGGMRVAPDAAPDDGVFDTVLIGDVTKPDFVTTFPKIYRGTHVGHPKVEVLRAATVTIDAEQPLPVVLDGEQPGTTPARFEIVPAALRVRVL